MMFNEEYRPRSFKEIHGQNKPLKDIIAWLNTWPNDKKALLIHGPSGVGKTVAIYVIKNEMDLDLIELNTSDTRNAETISRIVGNAASSKALFSTKKAILIDEADNIKGRSDIGGIRALAKVIQETENPIILLANDPYKLPISIKDLCNIIRFNSLRSASIRNRLKEIVTAANIKISEDVLKELASKSAGDMRAAINDLESLGRTIYQEDVEQLFDRDVKNSIFEGLTAIFKSKGTSCRKVFYDIDMPPEEILYWIDENMPRIYDPRDVACAYYYLSRADVFLGRVNKRQYYRLWAYASDLMTGGVSVCHKYNVNFARYESPGYFKSLGRTKAKRKLTKSALFKIGAKTHSSTYDAKAFLPMLNYACIKPESGVNVARYFGFDPDELELVCPKTAKDILSLIKKEEAKIKQLEQKARKKKEKDEEKKKPQIKKSSSVKSQQTSLFQF